MTQVVGDPDKRPHECGVSPLLGGDRMSGKTGWRSPSSHSFAHLSPSNCGGRGWASPPLIIDSPGLITFASRNLQLFGGHKNLGLLPPLDSL